MTFEGDLASYFWQRVDRRGDDECWPWTAGLNGSGYGQISRTIVARFDAPGALAHRTAFLLAHGSVPADLSLDHECHNRDVYCPGGRCVHRRCCNPAHLVPKTRGENIVAAIVSRRKDECPSGHELTPENTRWVKNRAGEPTWRRCRTCQREQMKKSRG